MEKQTRGPGMGSGFVRVTLIPSIALAALSIVLTTSACADSIPLFTATRGSGTLSLNWGEGRMLWSVTGPSLSLSFGGDINVPQCNTACTPGSSFSPDTQIANFGDFFGSGTVGGIYYPALLFFTGAMDISGGNFIISGVNPAFQGPVTYSGALWACTTIDGVDCDSQKLFGLSFARGGTFTAGFFGPSLFGYNLESGKYTIVAEPSTLTLLASGLAAVGGLARRRRMLRDRRR